ncbi:uncharacterized protein LY89DRAFT_731867 [Mollisia scopiformis]|uniref:Uncharacterized protein n=1 Tax=Mollisia scopiformis TaxID=149040 RepID=A0A194XGZ3_MOLSC|nr:uncharacterized protein LY89DRAFT_731867 [Mollisia scopiformis]KUJ19470.1 hypothetical protein LY89DRAFT_731867 [Mollisia scopiformis]
MRGQLSFHIHNVVLSLRANVGAAESTEIATLDPNMLNTNGLYWMLVETGLALIAVNLPLLYGTVRKNATNGSSSKISSTHRKNSGSQEYGDHIELAYGVQNNSDTKATSAQPLDPIDVEASNIKITKSYGVDWSCEQVCNGQCMSLLRIALKRHKEFGGFKLFRYKLIHSNYVTM